MRHGQKEWGNWHQGYQPSKLKHRKDSEKLNLATTVGQFQRDLCACDRSLHKRGKKGKGYNDQMF